MVTAPRDLTAPLFRRDVVVDSGHGGMTSARLHISSLGVHEAHIGGRPVGDDVLSPGWSAYEWRLHYLTHDVTDLIGDGFVLTVFLPAETLVIGHDKCREEVLSVSARTTASSAHRRLPASTGGGVIRLPLLLTLALLAAFALVRREMVLLVRLGVLMDSRVAM